MYCLESVNSYDFATQNIQSKKSSLAKKKEKVHKFSNSQPKKSAVVSNVGKKRTYRDPYDIIRHDRRIAPRSFTPNQMTIPDQDESYLYNYPSITTDGELTVSDVADELELTDEAITPSEHQIVDRSYIEQRPVV